MGLPGGSQGKGALIVSLIDYEIKNRTNNEKDQDDFERLLFESYSAYYNNGNAKRRDNYCLLQEMNTFTDSDFSEFFNKYIFGTELLPVSWLQSDEDGDTLMNYEEILFDTKLDELDTDGDGFHDNEEIDSGSDPTLADSYPPQTPTLTASPEPTSPPIITSTVESTPQLTEQPRAKETNKLPSAAVIGSIGFVVLAISGLIVWRRHTKNR